MKREKREGQTDRLVDFFNDQLRQQLWSLVANALWVYDDKIYRSFKNLSINSLRNRYMINIIKKLKHKYYVQDL